MKVRTQFDLPEVLSTYRTANNYEIYTSNQGSRRCFIYFSSHGIYYPNDSRVFYDRITKGNRFDWRKNIVSSSRKIILVRDVLKTWYLKGINAKLDTVEKTLDFLREETAGLEVVCVGSSAGGFAATLFGNLLRAEHIFSFSGQFSLMPYLNEERTRESNPVLVKNEFNRSISQYYCLENILMENKRPTFYFYPLGSKNDCLQAQFVKHIEPVHRFAFRSKKHSKTCYPLNFLDLFTKKTTELIEMSRQHKFYRRHPLCFSLGISGWRKTTTYLLGKSDKNNIK